MSKEIKVIIEDKLGHKVAIVLDTETGLAEEINYSDIASHNIANISDRHKVVMVPNIASKNIKTTVRWVNDAETYCRLNNKLDILNEYMVDKNGIQLRDVTKSCTKRLWWKCSVCGYEYQAGVQGRIVGSHYYRKDGSKSNQNTSGCPACAAKAGKARHLVPGYNDLETWCKENDRLDLLEEYSPKNPKKPSEITAKNDASKVEWICKHCGREFYTMIGWRVSEGAGCPYCGKNSGSYPELLIYNYYKHRYKDVRYRYKINKCEADIYIADINTVIDYRGSLWHSTEEAKDRDNFREKVIREFGAYQIIIHEHKDTEDKDTKLINDTVDTMNISKFYVSSLKPLISMIDNKLNLEFNNEFYEDSILETNKLKQSHRKIDNITETNPEILNIWDYDKNEAENIEPEAFTRGTKYSAWFKCRVCGDSEFRGIRMIIRGAACQCCGHSYKESIHKADIDDDYDPVALGLI